MAQSRAERLLLVTGLSGAGKSTTLKRLEDMGYEAIDNVPLGLLGSLAAGGANMPAALAVGIDARTRDFQAHAFAAELDGLRAQAGLDVKLLYLDCDEEVLHRRFTETRRRHPLAADRPVIDGIRHERRLMEPMRDRADLVLDTTALSAADLARLVAGHFALSGSPGLRVFVLSFGFRRGVPRDADLMFDVRFLANPHYIDVLRPLTGLDPAVAAFVEQDPDFAGFFQRLEEFLRPLLPRYAAEGRHYLTIAIGCTGGRHRSVVVAEKLAEKIAQAGAMVQVNHRDIT